MGVSGYGECCGSVWQQFQETHAEPCQEEKPCRLMGNDITNDWKSSLNKHLGLIQPASLYSAASDLACIFITTPPLPPGGLLMSGTFDYSQTDEPCLARVPMLSTRRFLRHDSAHVFLSTMTAYAL